MIDDIITQSGFITNNVHLVELNRFAELGPFTKSFIENEFANWLYNIELGDHDSANYVEERLKRLPFESAYCYKNTEFYLETNLHLLTHVFKEPVDWRYNPELVRKMPTEVQQKIYKHFEYMLYYVINTRDEIEFDIRDILETHKY